MKTNNPANYRLVTAVFHKFCEDKGLTPFVNGTVFEHYSFCCSAQTTEGETKHFIAVDAACAYCDGNMPSYCFNCGRRCEIDFEDV